MGLISATVKGITRFVNNTHANHQREKAKQISYNKTGKEIQKARKKGIYINASQIYHNEYNKRNKKISNFQNSVNNFISDI